MKLIKWEHRPMLNGMVDALFNNSLYDGNIHYNCIPPVDIKEDNTSYILTADIPGFKKSEIDVTIEGDNLSISGQRNKETNRDNETFHYQERNSGDFIRTFKLPDDSDKENITGSFRNGILSLIIPKLEQALPKTIKIEVK